MPELEIMDVRPFIDEERAALVELLTSLPAGAWTAPSPDLAGQYWTLPRICSGTIKAGGKPAVMAT